MLDETVPLPSPTSPARFAPASETRTRVDRPRRRASYFLHEPAERALSSRLRVGLIADGTTRGGPNGIAQGADRVIACAERCAERGDVDLLAAFILSPKNLMRRKRPFFATLHTEFLRLLEGVVSGRLLADVRVEIVGRLDRLRDKGGPAARLADVAELLEQSTSELGAPRMRLALCIDYEETSPITLGLDLLVRTGMEAPGVMRLSGLRVRSDTRCLPSVKLWRDFTPADLDAALAEITASPRVLLAPGYSSAFVEGLLEELSRTDLGADVRVTVPVAAPGRSWGATLARAFQGPLADSGRVAVRLPHRWQGSTRLGAARAPVEVRLVTTDPGSPFRPGSAIGWIAPGQSSGHVRLLERTVGDANIHLCEATPAAVVESLRRAVQFHAEHPPLHGAPRVLERRESDDMARLGELLRRAPEWADVPAEVVAREISGGGEIDVCSMGEVFAVKCLLEARSCGLVSGEVAWERQAIGYAFTAFAIGFVPGGASAREGQWEPRTAHLARVMLALAASDEEISDRVFPRETEGQRRHRLRVSVDYLVAVVEGKTPPAPGIPGRGMLESIARVWTAFFTHGARGAEPAIVDGVRRAAAALYRANLAEVASEDGLFDALSACQSLRDAQALIGQHGSAWPGVVTARLRDLLARAYGAGTQDTPDPWLEIRLLSRLLRVAPSIGAGCALLAMTATEPEREVPPAAVGRLLETASLIDCYFRLVNDLAFDDLGRGDRDRKPTTFTCLIPRGLRGKARELACVAALRTCRATAGWLHAEIQQQLVALGQIWPIAARWWRRGAHVGRRVYERGHYDRLTREGVSAILAELDGPNLRDERHEAGAGARGRFGDLRNSSHCLRAAG